MASENIDWKKYFIVFLITIGLFLTASYVSNYFGDRKFDQLQTIQDEIALNILSSETEFSLLSELSCKNITGTTLSQQLDEFAGKLEWGQQNLGPSDEVTYLKKYYSLLQIKDYLLMKNVSKRCGNKAAFILYFYTTAENCTECERQSIALSSLRATYPELRVYSFDFSTDLSAVQALLKIYKIEDTKLPALIVDDELLTGYHDMDELGEMVEKSFGLQEQIEDAKAELDTKQKKAN